MKRPQILIYDENAAMVELVDTRDFEVLDIKRTKQSAYQETDNVESP